MDTRHTALIDTLERITPVSASTRAVLIEAFKPACFAKDAFLVNAGDVNDTFFFIVKGVVRFVYTTEDGKEFNKSFAAENNFVACLRSVLANQPCRFSIQALEPCETLNLTGEKYQAFARELTEWNTINLVVTQQLALKKEEREAEFLLDSAETRYRNFIRKHPKLADRLQQYHIASYLGITDVALSRIRKRLKYD